MFLLIVHCMLVKNKGSRIKKYFIDFEISLKAYIIMTEITQNIKGGDTQ